MKQTQQQDAPQAARPNQTHSAAGPQQSPASPTSTHGQPFAALSSNSARVGAASAQRKAISQNGLPDTLKSGIETLSGMSMDHVKVHYNSSEPGRINAHAYTQGSNIYVAPGQEKHLAHEAWHVVQQAQGRVRPTLQMKSGVQVNDDGNLEAEADAMGVKAMSVTTMGASIQRAASETGGHQESLVLQKMFRKNPDTGRSDEVEEAKARPTISTTESDVQNTSVGPTASAPSLSSPLTVANVATGGNRSSSSRPQRGSKRAGLARLNFSDDRVAVHSSLRGQRAGPRSHQARPRATQPTSTVTGAPAAAGSSPTGSSFSLVTIIPGGLQAGLVAMQPTSTVTSAPAAAGSSSAGSSSGATLALGKKVPIFNRAALPAVAVSSSRSQLSVPGEPATIHSSSSSGATPALGKKVPIFNRAALPASTLPTNAISTATSDQEEKIESTTATIDQTGDDMSARDGSRPKWSQGHGTGFEDAKQGVKNDKTVLFKSGAQSVTENWGKKVFGGIFHRRSGPIYIYFVPTRSDPKKYRVVGIKNKGEITETTHPRTPDNEVRDLARYLDIKLVDRSRSPPPPARQDDE